MPQQISMIDCNIVDEEGLFKATMLWDKIVTHLEESIKCGRHTQSLKTYTNCFQGSKAVDCLLVHLNGIQPKPVKRHQVQTLCQKLVLTGVIEDVKDKEKGVFREGRLYKLTRNHFWASSTERKLPRTRSAEEICVKKALASECVDLKGYASDSTVMSSHEKHTVRKKRKCKERGRGGRGHYTKTSSNGALFPPLNSGMFKMKSTGSILNTPDYAPSSLMCELNAPDYTPSALQCELDAPDYMPSTLLNALDYTPSSQCALNVPDYTSSSLQCELNALDYTPSSLLCKSRESLLFQDTRHRRKTSTSTMHRRKPDHSYAMGGRRGSVDNCMERVCGACGSGGTIACKTTKKWGKVKDDPRHAVRDKPALRSRHLSHSLREKERNRKHSHHEDPDYAVREEPVRKCSLNRSLSFSSVGDYEDNRARVTFEPIHHRHASTSASKWVVYGYF